MKRAARSGIVVCFRQDLRLCDHPALAAAAATGEPVWPVYVWDPESEGAWPPGAASRWWLHHSLVALDEALASRYGRRLTLLQGPLTETLGAFVETVGARAVYRSRVYEPEAAASVEASAAALHDRGLEVRRFPGGVLFEPDDIGNRQGLPYRVFSAYWRACREQPEPVEPLPAPERLPGRDPPGAGVAVQALGLLPRVPWDSGLRQTWTPGEKGAQDRLKAFLRDRLADYGALRDRPEPEAVSRLSPHLHAGEISPRTVYAGVRSVTGLNGRALLDHPFCRELGWREFGYALLLHFPRTPVEPLDAAFRSWPWLDRPELRRAWQKGRTGYPFVDAGMRQLWATGWMHNRARMVVASLLVKDMGVNWTEGAAWFWDTLVDADLADNTLGWQWTAGCGADAAPYFRVFNPVLQGQRFDPEGRYVRQWVPELARLDARWIHQPSRAPAEVLDAAGIRRGRDYPLPVVDHEEARRAALARYEARR